MSAAAARAEARRKAILARGSDRLAKLTTSARGEDATYLHDDHQATHSAAVDEFVGESSGMNMPAPTNFEHMRRTSPSPAWPLSAATSSGDPGISSSEGSGLDPDVWSPELQQRFLQALMAGAQQTGGLPNPQMRQRKVSQLSQGDRRSVSREGSVPPFDAAITSLFPSDPQFDKPKKRVSTPMARGQKDKPLFQKLVPVIHMVATGSLLLWFVLWQGGDYSYLNNGGDMSLIGNTKSRFWERWAELSLRRPQPTQDLGMIFWVFTTLQIVLHSTRLLSRVDDLQPPSLLTFILPHLPQQVSSSVLSALRYLQMLSMLLDDIAWLVVAMGFLVLIATIIVA